MATATKSKNKINIRPLEDRVIVQPTEAEQRTANGIYLPSSAQEKPMQGKVVAAGPGKVNDDDHRTPLSVKVGDTVIYGKYSGTEVELEGDSYVLLRETELLAKLD